MGKSWGWVRAGVRVRVKIRVSCDLGDELH